MAKLPTLKLVREHKIGELVTPDKPTKRWEASGVLAKDGQYFVVFDDRTEIARIADDLHRNERNGLFGVAHGFSGYEGITFNTVKRRYYLLVESHKHSRGRYKARLVEYDERFKYLKDRPLDFEFESGNKGFEAVAHVPWDGKDFVLALCEGNKCKCGKQGRKPGAGRIQVFEKKRKHWRHRRTIELPTTVRFEDYSGMSVANGRVAIVSQVNSMLWVGRFDTTKWTWRDAGQLYVFPRSGKGSILYGNIEGVAWISRTRVVAVSDRRKKSSQPDKGLSEKDQSVHLFDIPG